MCQSNFSLKGEDSTKCEVDLVLFVFIYVFHGWFKSNNFWHFSYKWFLNNNFALQIIHVYTCIVSSGNCMHLYIQEPKNIYVFGDRIY